MKTPEDRAREVIAASDAPNTLLSTLVSIVAKSFREYGAEVAAQQRSAFCDSVMALELCGECPEASTYTRDDAFNAVLATPLVGETGAQSDAD